MPEPKFVTLPDGQQAEICECPLEVLDHSYRQLNRMIKWLCACVVCIAAHCGCTLPTQPDTGAKTVVTKTAGWGNGKS